MARFTQVFIALLLSCGAGAKAAEPVDSVMTPIRPVESAYTIGFGSSHMADTYLSPLKYSGCGLSVNYSRRQAMKFNPEDWVMRLGLSVRADRAVNPARNATMWYGGLDFSWAMMRRWMLPSGFSAGIGPAAMLDAGCLYSARNGNNPASAKASVMIGAMGYAAWNGRIGRLPVTLRYTPVLPVGGVFFAPDYGELYYEIYLGNHSGLVHPAWWGNYFRLDNMLTADLHFGSTSLRLGYGCRIHTTRVNSITTRHFTHEAVIGISGQWLSFGGKYRPASAAKVISSRY